MEKRKMEKLGIETSLLGFGCMRFPVLENGEINEPEAERMLDKAIAEGVNYIDTAYPYHEGKSEIVTGKILKKYDRDSFYLATKLPLWQINSLEDVDRIFGEQLTKLQTDHVDFYLMHAMNKERWDAMRKLGVVERLEQIKAEGRIRYLGFSFHDSYEAFEEIINAREWDFCQIQLNYMDVEEQAGLKGYELAASKNVPVIVMEPVKGGSLAAFAEDIMEKFRAADAQASAASFALRWVGSLPGVKVILSGMSTMGQVEDNLKTFGCFKPLSGEEQKMMKEVRDTLKSRVQNGCTACRYCMPCPAGVDIPGCFGVWNTYHMYQNYNMVKRRWENELGEQKQAKNCVKCGKCEQACPQKLSIRKDLERAQADLDKKEMAF
ncbi:MAG: aldo/keto reductase [Lachnospiraceae bacterium]|jgi:predicted aldo/keto reductase-like oxidoreductase|nr:aldo/keto reductase [Lachnospiraceae bacterium]MCI9095096.1 aldo/keto reductase [Lachnospiraceae bacterium]